MPDFIVRSRTTGPITEATVTADTREHAVDQTVQGAADDEQVDILTVTEVVAPGSPPPPEVPPPGAEGASPNA